MRAAVFFGSSLARRAAALTGLAVAACLALLATVLAVGRQAEAAGDWRLLTIAVVAAALVHTAVIAGLGLFALRWIVAPAEAAIRRQLAASEQEREAAARAHRHSEAQARFLATMSHELRTPLNAVLGFAQMLESAPLDARQSRYVQNIRESGLHLLDLINDVLDLAKVRSGELTLHDEVVSVREVIAAVAVQLEPLALARRIEVRVESVEPEAELAHADPRRLRQVLINLVGNAVKFSPDGAPVTIRASEREGAVLVEVADRGPGIPEADRERIFDEFEQLDDGRTRAHEGTGLGLALSRRLARAMGGDIAVEARSGGGSVFRLRVPGSRLPEPVAGSSGLAV